MFIKVKNSENEEYIIDVHPNDLSKIPKKGDFLSIRNKITNYEENFPFKEETKLVEILEINTS